MREHTNVEAGDTDREPLGPSGGDDRGGNESLPVDRTPRFPRLAAAAPAGGQVGGQGRADCDGRREAVQADSTTVALEQLEHVVLLSDRGPIRFSDDLVPQRQSSSVTALLDKTAHLASFPVTWVSPSTARADARARRLGLFRGLSEELAYQPDVVLLS